eukprot:1147995-Pelagomonas_calceolata.AAC.7
MHDLQVPKPAAVAAASAQQPLNQQAPPPPTSFASQLQHTLGQQQFCDPTLIDRGLQHAGGADPRCLCCDLWVVGSFEDTATHTSVNLSPCSPCWAILSGSQSLTMNGHQKVEFCSVAICDDRSSTLAAGAQNQCHQTLLLTDMCTH